MNPRGRLRLRRRQCRRSNWQILLETFTAALYDVHVCVDFVGQLESLKKIDLCWLLSLRWNFSSRIIAGAHTNHSTPLSSSAQRITVRGFNPCLLGPHWFISSGPWLHSRKASVKFRVKLFSGVLTSVRQTLFSSEPQDGRDPLFLQTFLRFLV